MRDDLFVLKKKKEKRIIQIHKKEKYENSYHNKTSTITRSGIVIILNIEKVDLSQCLIARIVKYDCNISKNHLMIKSGILATVKERIKFHEKYLNIQVNIYKIAEKLVTTTAIVIKWKVFVFSLIIELLSSWKNVQRNQRSNHIIQ